MYKLFSNIIFLIISFFVLLSSGIFAQESVTKKMSFNSCLKVIRSTASQFGIAPKNIVETNDMRMVRFNTSNGSILITCSRPDQKMVLTKSK